MMKAAENRPRGNPLASGGLPPVLALESRSRGGRAKVPIEIRHLIRGMSLANRLWGAPLAIACDIDEIQIRTLFTGSVSVTHTIRLADLNDVSKRQLLRRCFTDPESLKPVITPRAKTEDAARKFATLAQNLRKRRDRINQPHDPRRIAHFLNKIVFCLFAEDAGLLPGNVFSSIIEEAVRDRSALSNMLVELFERMRKGDGRFGTISIPWFNGGLFDDDDALELTFTEVLLLADAMRLDWASIEPVISARCSSGGLILRNANRWRACSTLLPRWRKSLGVERRIPARLAKAPP